MADVQITEEEMTIVEMPEEELEVEDTADGGAVIKLESISVKEGSEHFANIVEEVDRSKLRTCISDLLTKIGRDKEARQKRDKQYEEGLRRTGLGDDAPGGAQFAGANKVVHPMLVEACVDFSARFIKEIFPPNGPVKSKIIGETDKVKVEKAQRKTEFMNWQATEQMVEFRSELEQLSTQLPLGGGQYMKYMWSPQHNRPTSEFVPIDDVYLPFSATNFYTAERKTHVQYITHMEYQKRVDAGMYSDVDLPSPNQPEFSKAEQANEKIEGKQDTSYNEDGLRTIYEVYTYLEMEDEYGLAPYILSIDKSSDKPLSLYRNWEEDDAQMNELDWMVEFPFVPWRGAYPIGLTHMIGGLSGAATGALRALLDSAYIQNVPTLLKLKGGPNGQTLNVQPTEIVEMEGGALVDDVRKLAMPLPFAGPSPTLFQLLGFLVDAGKGVVQTSFEKFSDQNPNAPVGTTMAIIEQGMVVFSSIHSRLHSAMARSFNILHRINSAYYTQEGLDAIDAGLSISADDFDGPSDVVPISNPAIFSEAQRFAQIQAIMQRAALMPQMYDQRAVEEMFLRTLKVPGSEVLNPMPGSEDRDPVSENVAAAMGQGIYVLPYQDHLAHMEVHLPFLKSPLFGSNPTITPVFLYPMALHLRDHLLNYYLAESHQAIDQAQRREIIGDDAEQEVEIILRVQKFIEEQLGGFGQELAQINQAAQQFKPEMASPGDEAMKIAELSAQMKQSELQQKAEKDTAQLQLNNMKLETNSRIQELKIAQTAEIEQAKLAAAEADRVQRTELQSLRELAETERNNVRQMSETDRLNTREMNENKRKEEDLAARERMNASDNMTAKELAEMEIESGEKVAVSTGTGIDQNP
jgi:chaperonin GroES